MASDKKKRKKEEKVGNKSDILERTNKKKWCVGLCWLNDVINSIAGFFKITNSKPE